MISGEAFVDAIVQRGYRFFAGVPCSYLTPLMNAVLRREALQYVAAANEGEAVAIAAGAWLAGQKSVVMCQNSGLGNAVNPLTSLSDPFRIPALLVVSRRGEPGVNDEPQHHLMGKITLGLLDAMDIAHRPFPADEAALEERLDWADETATRESRPVALVVSRGTIEGGPRPVQPAARTRPRSAYVDHRACGPLPRRATVLESLVGLLPPTAAVIATTGKTGRELFTIADRPQYLYQVGSMGCASSLALGVALFARGTVVVVDGDGAALMHMGALATIGYYAPKTLVHVILDNAAHDSTGGQFTVSPVIDFPALGAACAYARVYSCDSVEGFAAALRASLESAGPHLIHARIAAGSMTEPGRPDVAPVDVARRFRAFLRNAEQTGAPPAEAR